MNRREFVLATIALSMQACSSRHGPLLLNPCDSGLPAELRDDPLVQDALEGIDASLLWDGHVHLIGTGDSNSGIWLNPRMQRFYYMKEFLQFKFYLNAACADQKRVDLSFVERLLALQKEMPYKSKVLLLAFDYTYNEKGECEKDLSAFHTPNDYAARTASEHPQQFEWIASIHPYRKDAAEAVYAAFEKKARAVKWLPPAMGMDPASPLCDAFYEAMHACNLPLLVHAGEEKAVHGANKQDYGNPLRLRRALEQGARVIVAHCASLGDSVDIESDKQELLSSFNLFTRLMEEKDYEGLLFGEISALTQINRLGDALNTLLLRQDWHARLLNASDYPLPAVMPLFSLRKMINKGYITEQQGQVLGNIRQYNALFFDLLLKRMLRFKGQRFQDVVFASRRVFEPA
ncbi:MAG: amidohydrolase family protein [Gammaproteobacteria bacterium]|nr:amidohydrolase family protein [Gammaproteobacteria bacterium]